MTNHTHESKKTSKHRDNNLTIVGVGTSAGGLSALKAFFKEVPEDSGFVYVIVMHLSPDRESHLATLLQPHVKIPVQQVTKTIALKPDNVYLIPPGNNLDAIDTHLRLSKIEKNRRDRAPVDHFFRTLAKTHDGHSVGVILTGTGSDGTLGIKEIKAKGGLTIVQDPNEAEFDGMPQSAMATSLIDFFLPIRDIYKYISRFANTNPKIKVPNDDDDNLGKQTQKFLHKIFTQVRSLTGRDFSNYKQSTVMRRIQRRMQLFQIETLENYLTFLRENKNEVQALSDEFLITVTNFFRDPKVFKQLEKEVIPQLFKGKNSDQSIRVWSVGCATGEEAYSIAILILEETARQEVNPEIQIFASDLHDHSLQKARDGFFHGDITLDVSKQRLQRFFIKEDGGYRIKKEVREMVVFSPHNLLSDPPFSRIDFIACRNLLIYLKRNIQKDVIELFHYALKPEGYLLLGNAETMDSTELFHTEHKANCLFRKRNVPVPEPQLPVFPLVTHRLKLNHESNDEEKDVPMPFGVLHQKIIEQHAPPSLLVSPEHKVVHLSERVGRYLIHPGGDMTNNVFKLIRDEFRLELRSGLNIAKDKRKVFFSKPIAVKIEGEEVWVNMNIYPAAEKFQDGFCVVEFQEKKHIKSEERPSNEKGKSEGVNEKAIQKLENELSYTKQELQSLIEEYETSQEEMKAANEEMQSSNEELRSALEELETSKEELQSMNEELTTLNQENRHKVEELSQLSDALQNFLSATNIPTLFLDRQFRIIRFTPQIADFFNIRPADLGRSLSDYTHKLGYEDILKDAKNVLNNLTPIQREIQDNKGNWHLTRILPFRSTDHHIEGIVITFVDITGRKKIEEELEKEKTFVEHIVDSIPEPLLVLTKNLRIEMANKTFYKHFQVKQEDTLNEMIYDLGNGQWNIPGLRKMLKEIITQKNTVENYEVTHEFEGIGERVMLLNGCQMDNTEYILVSLRDISEIKKAERALRESENRYRTLFNSIDEGFCIIEMIFDKKEKPIDYRFLEVNPAFEKHTGLVNAVGKRMKEFVPDHEEYWFDIYGEIAKTGKSKRFTQYAGKLGNIWYDVYAFSVEEAKDHKVAVIFNDISDRKRTEEALRQSEEHLKLVMKSATDYAIITMDLDRNITDWNAGAEKIFGYKRKEIIGQKSDILFTEDDRKEQPQKEIKTAKEKGHAEDERFHQRKDGSRFYGSGTMMPLKGSSNKLHGFLKILTDTTQKREIEEELKTAKEKAEEAAHAKEEFLAHMSHEIRTPLNAIVGLSSLLLEQNPREDQRDNLNTLKFSSENLKVLINDILDFSKIQAGKIEIKENSFSLLELLDSLKKAHTPKAIDHGNDLIFEIDEKLPELICTDQLKLSQILHNLIGNAVKFTNQGLIKVEVNLQKKKGRHYWLDFSVRDSGIGISKDKLNKIFDSFTQEDHSSVSPSEGTGLGLTITKLLLDHMGSQIKVESKKNKGSRFFFSLQVKEGKNIDQTNYKNLVDLHDGDLKNFKLLVVEDMLTNRKLILQFLKQWWKFVPDEAKDGKEAVAMAKKNKYDMILMDVRMPEMDGYDATGVIRKLNDHYEDIPIIALTADTIGELKKHNESSLFSGILVKPFDPDDLRETIIKCVTKGKDIQKSGKKALSKPKKIKRSMPVNFTKLESLLYGDKTSIREYLESVLQSLTNVDEDYKKAMSDKDKKLLSDLKHRKTMLVDVLQLNRLKDLLEQSKDLLEKKSIKEEEIQNLKTGVEGELQRISEELEKKIKSLMGE